MHHRAHADPSRWQACKVRLSADATHHLVRVMRAERGASVIVFDGRGREADARFECVVGDEAELTILGERISDNPIVGVSLFQAIPKGKRMDLITEKAVELGASVIHPILSERGVVRLSAEQAVLRRDRLQRVALSAAKQCGASWLPEVRVPASLTGVTDELHACDLLLLACLRDDSTPLHAVLDARRGGRPGHIGLMIGPEGDWSDAEVEVARAAGATMVDYGVRVLRVDTAALYGLSVISYEMSV